NRSIDINERDLLRWKSCGRASKPQKGKHPTLKGGESHWFFRRSSGLLSARRPAMCVSSRSFHRLQLDRQVVHLWLHDLLIIAITHFDRVCVCTCFEHYVVLFRQTLVHIRWQTIEIAKWRHPSNGAVRKERLKILLRIQRDSFANGFLDFLQINMVVRGQHHHQMLFV